MKQITTPHGIFNAYLNRLPEANDTFHISFVDKENKAHVVLMQCICEQWIMINEYEQPVWVAQLLSQFIHLIKEEEALRFAA